MWWFVMTVVLTEDEVRSVLTVQDCVAAVEEAFRAYGEGRVNMPAKSYLDVDAGDFRAMYGEIKDFRGTDVCGLKWVNVHPNNPGRGLPTVMAVVVLNDPETGFPLAVMDGTYVTDLRTGAAAAVATKYLAKEDASILGIVGCGAQAYTQVAAIDTVRDITEIRAFDVDEDRKKGFCRDMEETYDVAATPAASLEQAVSGVDVLSTTTPVREPIIKEEWISPGIHCNAMGADAEGKQEYESAILKRAAVYVDDWAQASHSGEINVPLSQGAITREDVRGGLGDVVAGKLAGREGDDEVTLFDSTGLVLQDLVTGYVVYGKAQEQSLGVVRDFVSPSRMTR